MGTITTIPTIPEKFIPPDSSTITSGTGVGSAVGIAVEVGSGISVDAEEGSGTEVASTLVMVAGGAVTIIGAGTGVGGSAVATGTILKNLEFLPKSMTVSTPRIIV